MWAKLINGLLGGGLGAIDGLLGRFWKNKDALESNIHGETVAQLETYAAEFAPRENRTGWDSLVDGLNRLPRPVMAFGVIGLLAWAPVDPVGFSQAMRAYALVPEWLAGTLFGVAAFYFTARHFDKRLSFKGPRREDLGGALEDIRAMEALRSRPESGSRGEPAMAGEAPRSGNAPLSESAYQAALDDGETPLSNAAIAEWNRRRVQKL